MSASSRALLGDRGGAPPPHWTPRPLDRGWRQAVAVAVALAVLATLGVVEVRTPRDITLGAVLLLVVLISTWLLSVVASLLVTVAALAVPLVALLLGSDNAVVSEVEIMAVVVLGATLHVAIGAIQRYQHLLVQHNRELSQVNASLERFTADAAHELRAPLAVVQAEVGQAVARAATADELRTHLRAIGAEMTRMSRSVTALLTLARADAGVLQAAFTRVDLVDLLEVVAARWRLLCAAKRVVLLVRLPEVGEITCDPDLLARVLDNLLDNALRAVPASGRITLEAARDSGDWLISVTDTGPGVDIDAVSGALAGGTPLQAERRSRRSGGSGFGLALCAVIVGVHGGSISADNLAGGAAFRVRLPAVAA